MRNDFEIKGDEVSIFLPSSKYGLQTALISSSKLEKAQQFNGTWYSAKNPMGNYYVIGRHRQDDGAYKNVSLHRWITDAPKGMVVDHINHDTLNNLDTNLRVVTSAENSQNFKGPYTTNKSGFRGVHWYRFARKWRSIVVLNGKHIHLGLFINKEDAIDAVRTARSNLMPYSQDIIS